MMAGRGSCAGLRRHEAVDAVERVGGDAAAIAQPRGKLAVVDGAPAEGRFRQAGLAAIVGDFRKELLRIHGRLLPILMVSSVPWVGRSTRTYGHGTGVSEPSRWAWVNHKGAH